MTVAEFLNAPQLDTATIVDGILQIDGFVETDPEVIGVLTDSDDLVEALHKLLRLGARVARMANSSVDQEALSASVDRFLHEMNASTTTAMEQVSSTVMSVVDEKAGIPRTLAQFRTEFEQMLAVNFDPQSRASLIGKFEDLMVRLGSAQTKAVRDLLDPHAEDSPLRLWREEIIKTVRTESDLMRQAVQALAVSVAAQQASHQAQDKWTQKGMAFEDMVHAMVERCACVHEDSASKVGTETGAGGSKAGDELVLLSASDTGGVDLRIVWECKDTKMSHAAILHELDAAMKNREAVAGIAVFANQPEAGTAVPFVTFDSKAIVVVDKDDPDEGVVRLAYMWARWVALRKLLDVATDLDVAHIESLIQQARQTVNRVSEVRTNTTHARKGIEQAQKIVDQMAEGIGTMLDELAAELSKG